MTCGSSCCGSFFAMLEEEGAIHACGTSTRHGPAACRRARAHGRHARHIILFAKNQTGLRNLYHLISDSQSAILPPRAPHAQVRADQRCREGLIIGSACEAGELFQAIVDRQELTTSCKRIASFYDFLEIQPLATTASCCDKGTGAGRGGAAGVQPHHRPPGRGAGQAGGAPPATSTS